VTQTLTNLVQHYGIFAVFFLMAAESCGLPFPSEVIMPFSGALVAAGHLDLTSVVVAGALGNLAGSLVAYWLASRFGEPLLLGPGRYVGIRRSHIELADRWFRRHGLAAVFFGRMLPVIRTYISFPAGLAGVRLGPFAALTFLGALPWCAMLTLVGVWLGFNYTKVSRPIELAAIVIALIVAAGVVIWILRGRALARAEGEEA
jgi:membrane protein DedA with SNARE-associated domain